MREKVIVIGGGISGLVSGIYSLKLGFDTTIYEKNSYLGGLMLPNSKKSAYDALLYFPRKAINELFNDLEIEELNVKENDYLLKYHDLYLYKNLESLKEELIKKSSADKKIIEELIKNIYLAQKNSFYSDYPIDLMSAFNLAKLGFKMASTIKLVNKYSNISIKDYFEKVNDIDIKNMFLNIIPSFYPLYLLIFLLGGYANETISMIEENSQIIIDKLLDKFKSLGGIITTSKEALSIDVYHTVVNGVWFNNGLYANCNYIICALDIKYVYEKLLNNKYNDRKFALRFEDFKNYPIVSNVCFKFYVKGNIDRINDCELIDISKIKIATEIIDKVKIIKRGNELYLTIYQGYDDYQYWTILNKNKNLVNHEVNDIANKLIDNISSYYSNEENIEIRILFADCLLPIHYEEIGNCYCGAVTSFGLTSSGKMINHNGRITGLDNVYLAGQWISSPGGISEAILNGKYAMMRLANDNSINYKWKN